MTAGARIASRFLLAACVLAGACTQPATRPPERPPEASAQPGATPDAQPRAFSDSDFAGHVTVLRGRLGAKGLGELAIQVERPFVVLTDDTPVELDRHAETVRWAADHLERDFFAHEPTRIVDIYLFRDAAAYEAGVRMLTREPATTPFGFYSTTDDALFMNIATGGGTLIHEMVHPYVEADFPGAPAWLNEGLGSLFEQCAERDGHIIGLTNWRLEGLQHAIRDGTVPTVSALTQLSDAQFYGEGRDVHYAAARYLLYCLQEHDRLVPFYAAFRTSHATDPTGYATLVTTLDEPDMPGFDRRWRAWVMTLHFP